MKRWALLFFTNVPNHDPRCYHESFFTTRAELNETLEHVKPNLTRSTSWVIYERKEVGHAKDIGKD